MKGIVMEIVQKDAVILTEDGIFTKIKNQKYSIGQTVDTQMSLDFGTRNRMNIGTKWVAGAASMAAALAISTIGAFAYYTPTDYVSMDVNPSIEYTVNMFDRILEARAMNEDGSEILSDLKLKNKDLKAGMEETLDQLIKDGYLADGPDGGVVITTSNEEQSDAVQLAEDLKKELKTYLVSQKGITASVDAEAVKPEKVEQAKDLGVSPGKLTLVEKLQESTTGAIHVDEWLNKPVKEINKAIKENRKAEKDSSKDEQDQDVSAESPIDPADGSVSYPGKSRQVDVDKNGKSPNVTTGSGIVPNSTNSWYWDDSSNNGSGQDRGWGNGQGNGSIKDWFDNNNGNGRDWGPEWTTTGGIELPAYGNSSNKKTDDAQSDNENRSNKGKTSDDED